MCMCIMMTELAITEKAIIYFVFTRLTAICSVIFMTLLHAMVPLNTEQIMSVEKASTQTITKQHSLAT